MKHGVVASISPAQEGHLMDHVGTGVALTMATSAALAQVITGDPMGAVRDYGVAVAVIGWFMWRNERRLENLTAEVKKLSKAIIVASMDDHTDRDRLKKEVLKELDEP